MKKIVQSKANKPLIYRDGNQFDLADTRKVWFIGVGFLLFFLIIPDLYTFGLFRPKTLGLLALVIVLSAWAFMASYEKCEFNLNPNTRLLTGWKKSFRKMEFFNFSMDEIKNVTVIMTKHGHRIVLVAANEEVEITNASQAGYYGAADDAKMIRRWLWHHGVKVPLVWAVG